MDEEFTLVSAYFRINRENWKNFERNDEVYFSYFEHWARIKNQLIVFVENEQHKNQILKIREKFGNINNTDVIIIDDVYAIDPELFEIISNACLNPIHKAFRLTPNHPEVIYPVYDYIMALKFWFLREAVIRNLNKSNQMAWIDFGFGHGDQFYPNAREFDFTWKSTFGNKLYFPSMTPDDNRPIFDVVRTMDVYAMGCLLVGSAEQWKKAWKWMRDAVCALADCGFADDDQTALLMISRKHPEAVELTPSESWTLFMKEHGADHLTVREESWLKSKISDSKINYIRLQIRRLIKVIKYSFRQINVMMKGMN